MCFGRNSSLLGMGLLQKIRGRGGKSHWWRRWSAPAARRAGGHQTLHKGGAALGTRPAQAMINDSAMSSVRRSITVLVAWPRRAARRLQWVENRIQTVCTGLSGCQSPRRAIAERGDHAGSPVRGHDRAMAMARGQCGVQCLKTQISCQSCQSCRSGLAARVGRARWVARTGPWRIEDCGNGAAVLSVLLILSARPGRRSDGARAMRAMAPLLSGSAPLARRPCGTARSRGWRPRSPRSRRR